jgi:hypothetical protein
MQRKSLLSLAIFIFSLTTCYILHAANTVHAQSAVRSYTITPPTLLAPLAPSKSTEGKMAIRNETDEPVSFNVTVQDFIVSDTRGTPTILAPDTLSNKYSAASWIGVSPTRFTVPAHGRQELSYYIQVPSTARPGGHYAAVVYSPATDKGVGSTGATVNSQIGTLFSVTIDGPITEKALVSKFSVPFFQEYGPIDVQTQVKNLGDEHIHPLGQITVNSWFGKDVQPLHENNVFPEAARDYVNVFGQKWMFGRYVATFQGTYGRNNNLPLMATVVFWVFPWKLIVVIILVIVAAVLGYMLMKKNQTPPTKPGETEQKVEPTQPAASEQ